MTAEVVNLRRVRKARKNAENRRQAEVNRRASGRTKSEKEADTARRELIERALERHRIERDDSEGT